MMLMMTPTGKVMLVCNFSAMGTVEIPSKMK